MNDDEQEKIDREVKEWMDGLQMFLVKFFVAYAAIVGLMLITFCAAGR